MFKYIVKDPAGQTALQTFDPNSAQERAAQPGYKLVTVPVAR